MILHSLIFSSITIGDAAGTGHQTPGEVRQDEADSTQQAQQRRVGPGDRHE